MVTARALVKMTVVLIVTAMMTATVDAAGQQTELAATAQTEVLTRCCHYCCLPLVCMLSLLAQ